MTVTEAAPPQAPTPEPERSSIGSFVVIALAAIVVAIVAIIGAVAVAAVISDDGGGGDAIPTTQLNVTLTEFALEGDLTAPAGNVVLNISNEGSIDHNVAVRELGLASNMLPGGGSTVLDLGNLSPGTYTLFCEVAGHEAAGMKADLVITEGAAGGEAAAPVEPEPPMDAAAMDQRMIDSMLAFPADSEGRGNQPLEFELLPDGTKQFELTAAVTPWEVSPGIRISSCT